MNLAGKVCVITGTGGSMGRAAALVFAEQGALVVGSDLQEDQAERTVQLVTDNGGTMVSMHPCDLPQQGC
jgi:NAD(P)-dependent dehydrogenase (short-subunit alcohol dehydrogenase family)